MKSSITFVCPVSGQRAKSNAIATPEGEWHDVPESEITPPVGWGSLVLDVVVPNHQRAAVEARREMERTTLRAVRNDPSVPAEVRNSAPTDAALEAQLDATLPLPSETRVLRYALPVVGPEALVAILAGLRAAGVTVPDPTEA